MARKGNQQKNGLNRNMPQHKNKVPDRLEKGKSRAQNVNFADTEYSNDESMCRSSTPGASMKETKASGKGVRKKNVLSREKSDDKSRFPQSVDGSRKLGDLVESHFSSDASEIGDNMKSGNLDEEVRVEDDLDKSKSADVAFGMNLRAASLCVLKATIVWLEQQKPRFRIVASVICKGHNYIRAKVDHVYSVIWPWTLCFGKLVFLLSMIWLDCSIRGLDSLLRLGATSFITVVWCSILSVTAMIGFTKMLMIMVIAILLAFFTGLELAILLIASLLMVILWFYGSFWMTMLVVLLGGITFTFGQERVALLVTTVYSVQCAKSYVGWLGLLLALNLSFISSDILMLFLKNNVSESNSNDPSEQARQTPGPFGESFHSSAGDGAFPSASERSADHDPSFPSTSGTELTSEDEVVRLLNCTDHYAALGFLRYENVDVSQLKKEYRKKAMLVHPDKNMGNEKAADAFKKLQNAYEVLLDSLKRKTYDEELRREELLNYFRRFRSGPREKGRQGNFRPEFSHSEAEFEGLNGEARRIACKKCSDFHVWRCTGRSKSQARWCQDCKEFHQSKDGDGWVEQSCQSIFFGLLQKMDTPCAYACAGSKVFDVTEWFICQGMRCPANTHKPSFHVNTNLTRQTSSKGTNSATRGGGIPTSNIDETMTEEEFFEWLQNAVQSGIFDADSAANESPKNGSCPKSNAKKKRKGKKQW